jgi:hypothetical protein
MLRNALLLCAGLLAATTFACVVVPPPSPPPPVSAAAARGKFAAATCADGHAFTDHVKVLNPTPPNYPFMNAGGYDPPFNHATAFMPDNNPNITNDLNNAFNMAPPLVQMHLCQLNAIYINPNDCANSNPYYCATSSGTLGSGEAFNGAWGFRSRVRNQNDYGFTYVSISAALWYQGQSAWPLDTYENSVLEYLVQAIGAPAWNGLPTLGPANLNSSDNSVSSAMTVLAALAHELGHVRWAILGAHTPGDPFNFNMLTKCGPTNSIFLWAGIIEALLSASRRQIDGEILQIATTAPAALRITLTRPI